VTQAQGRHAAPPESRPGPGGVESESGLGPSRTVVRLSLLAGGDSAVTQLPGESLMPRDSGWHARMMPPGWAAALR
jgi:hypothetical protein